MYADGSYGLSDKWLKGTSLEELCHIDDTKWIPKVRFVTSEL